MKAIANTGPNQLEMLEIPLPEPGPGQVRIRTGACGICATDLQMIAGWPGTRPRTGFRGEEFPGVPGHEWAGHVDALGAGVTADWFGRRCVAENVLSDGGEVGFEHPGGYGQYFLTEAANLHALPDDFPLATAALIEPLAVCARARRRLRLPGSAADLPVLILGDGPIGLLMLMLLRREGMQLLYLLGGRAQRLGLACQLGASLAINYHTIEDNLAAGVLQATAETSFQGAFAVVVEASGSPAAMQASLQLAAPGGRIGVLGDYGAARADFTWNHLLHREIELIGSNASASAWPEAVSLAVGGLPLDRLISHRLPAERFQDGLALARQRGAAIKVILEW
jgi:threonine dehydrogenase-like Zn-dependent dehydrogenase